MARARNIPPLVSRTRAAEILGVNKANIARYDELLKPHEVEVEGARSPAYVKTGVEMVARQLQNAASA